LGLVSSVRGFKRFLVASAFLSILAVEVGRAQAQAVTCYGRMATIVGTPGDDVIAGTNGPDVIAALGGNDVVDPWKGDDIVCGGSGHDSLSGWRGDDVLIAGAATTGRSASRTTI
jgi:Ca2+-binding RTX toxin-like protein